MKVSVIAFGLFCVIYNSPLISMYNAECVELRNGSMLPRRFVVATHLHLLALKEESPLLFNEFVKKAKDDAYELKCTNYPLWKECLITTFQFGEYVPVSIKNILFSALIDHGKEEYILISPFRYKTANQIVNSSNLCQEITTIK